MARRKRNSEWNKNRHKRYEAGGIRLRNKQRRVLKDWTRSREYKIERHPCPKELLKAIRS